MKVELDIAQPPIAETAHGQSRLRVLKRRRFRLSLEQLIHLRADDVPGHVLLGQPRHWQSGDPLAIAQHGHAIRQPEDLLQSVADIDDGHTVIPKASYDVVEDAHLGLGK
jgi:hypothetical protein